MPISASDLVKLAMERTQTNSPTELARALRMTGYTAPRNITRWLNGDSSPDYESTMSLLAAAGMLDLEATQPPTDVNATLDAVTNLDRRLDTDVIPRLEQIADELRRGDHERREVS